MGLRALGRALGEGRFRALTLLDLTRQPIEAAGIEQFTGALTLTETPISNLWIGADRMGDAGAKTLAVALREGRLGCQLKSFCLSGSQHQEPIHITEKGLLALHTAILDGQRHLKLLSHLGLYVPRVSLEIAEAFVVGVVVCCPAFKFIRLRTSEMSAIGNERVRHPGWRGKDRLK